MKQQTTSSTVVALVLLLVVLVVSTRIEGFTILTVNNNNKPRGSIIDEDKFVRPFSRQTWRHRCIKDYVPPATATVTAATSDGNDEKDEWVDLSNDAGVLKRILSTDGSGNTLTEGETATISYKGRLATANWSTDEVISCWLSQQQGMDDDAIVAMFRNQAIDESKLTDVETFFTESFIQESVGGAVSKIGCKKLIMAAKRLKSTRQEFPAGMEFDANDEYSVVVGPSSKLIRGMQLGIASMAVGETALLRIRSDYGYGSEGYRKRTGEVVVPPFSSLEFEITVSTSS